MRKIDKIIIHCSATAEGKAFTADDIRRWHTAPASRGGRGWRDIGYHYVVHLDGTVAKGRPESSVGAHCLGHNRSSIGICYIGGCASDGKTPKDTRTPAQKAAMASLIKELEGRYGGAEVYGHREMNPWKACPSFDAAELRES